MLYQNHQSDSLHTVLGRELGNISDFLCFQGSNHGKLNTFVEAGTAFHSFVTNSHVEKQHEDTCITLPNTKEVKWFSGRCFRMCPEFHVPECILFHSQMNDARSLKVLIQAFRCLCWVCAVCREWCPVTASAKLKRSFGNMLNTA